MPQRYANVAVAIRLVAGRLHWSIASEEFEAGGLHGYVR